MPAPQPIVITPASPQLDQLCRELASRADTLSTTGDWPREQLQLCAEAGVFRWFVPRSLGGLEWQPRQLAEGYLKLGAACLTTTFVITQWVAAVKRLLLSEHPQFVARRETLIEDLLAGRSHITVGISHLTTSRRHLSTPVLQLQATDSEFRLQGFSPWVTAASFADYFLIGATQADGQQALLLVEAAAPGITIESPQALVALSASCTGAVRFEDVRVPATHWIAGPRMNVLSTDGSVGTGGIQTSSLALALSKAAIDFIAGQADQRPELLERARTLDRQWQLTCQDLFELAEGRSVCSSEALRTRANSLVLRSTQAALVAAKGAGFVEGHPVGRWCREAMFFLVWSCPQTVQDANLCELVGIPSLQ